MRNNDPLNLPRMLRNVHGCSQPPVKQYLRMARSRFHRALAAKKIPVVHTYNLMILTKEKKQFPQKHSCPSLCERRYSLTVMSKHQSISQLASQLRCALWRSRILWHHPCHLLVERLLQDVVQLFGAHRPRLLSKSGHRIVVKMVEDEPHTVSDNLL